MVTYWFEKAREQVTQGKTKRVGLLATNSLRGGANRCVLQRIKESGDIFFAEADRPWILDGAAVRVSMVGFDDGTEQHKILDGAPADNIYADLTGSLDLSAACRLVENGRISIGTQKGGAFDLPADLAHRMLNAKGNPNGRPNSDVLRPWINGLDVTRRPRGMWIIDFGVAMPEDEAALYEAPFEYVQKHVKVYRTSTKSEKRTGENWWLHQRSRPEMREAIAPLPRYLATARVAKHRLFVWVSPEVLPDSQIVVLALSEDYDLGILHSHAHELWALRMGTSLEDRPRYSLTMCFETFPFPKPTDKQREEISAAAKRLDGSRRNWLDPEGASEAELKRRTLTNLYNARPTWLTNVHARLDRAVYAAYGWPAELPDEEVLKNLLALNLERSSGPGGL